MARLLVLLLLFPDLPFPNFHFQLKEKTREKSRKRSDMVQFGRWRDSFSSMLYTPIEDALTTNDSVRHIQT